jgi:hypothetical protein
MTKNKIILCFLRNVARERKGRRGELNMAKKKKN